MKTIIGKLCGKQGKRFLALLLAATLMIPSVMNDEQVSAAPELGSLSITNADMEDYTNNWFSEDVTNNWTGFRADSDVKHGGSRSGRNTVDSDATGDSNIYSSKISVTGGAMYTIGAWVYTADKSAGDSINLRVNQYDSSNTKTTSVLQSLYGNTSGWYELKGSIHLEPSTTQIEIAFANFGAGSKLYVDDVYGQRVSSSTSGGNVNADFETLTTAEGGYQFPTGWKMKGYGSETEGSLETPDFYATTKYYHSKENSTDANYGHSLYFAKNSKDNVTIENTNTFPIDAATYSEYACGAYIRSVNSDGFARVDLVVSDNGSNKKTITGYTKMLNAGDTLSDWACFYSEVNFAKLNLGFTPTKAYYQIVFTGDKVECYIDDLFCVGTNDGYGKIVDWSDFHAVSGGSAADAGAEEIVGWDVESGAASVANHVLTLTDGTVSHTDNHLMENKTYEVSVTNEAEATGGAGTNANLVTNGDFDTDGSMDTAGWSLGAGGVVFDTTEYVPNGGFDGAASSFTVSSATQEIVADPVDSSNTCLKVQSTAESGFVNYNLMNLTAGETYNITFKVYVGTTTSEDYLQPFIINRGGATTYYYLAAGKSTSTTGASVTAKNISDKGWVTYSCDVTATDDVTYWSLRFVARQTTTVWYLDDISVKHVAEYAENGGFDADTTGWSTNASSMTWGGSNGNGDGGVAVTNSVADQWIRTYVPVTGGQSYNFSYWFKSNTSASNARLYTTIIQRAADKSTKTYDTDYSFTNNNIGSASNANSYLIAGTLKPDSTWRNVVGQFTAAADTKYAEVRIRVGNGTDTVYIDDFSFTGLVGSDTDGIVANDGDNAMKLSDGNSASYTVALEAGNYEYSYDVANSGLDTAALKVGDTTYTATSGTFTLDAAVSEVAFATTGTGTAYFDDLVIKKVTEGNPADAWTTSIKFFDINGDEIDSSKVIGYSGDAVLSQTLYGSGTAKLSFLAPDGVYKAVVTISGNGKFTDFVISEEISVNQDSDWKSSFVWYPEDASASENTNQFRFFRHKFDVDTSTHGAVTAAYLQLCGDDSIWFNQVYLDSSSNCTSNPTTTSADGKRNSLFYTLNKSLFTDGTHVLSFATYQTSGNAGAVFEGCIEYEDGYKDYLYSGINGETLVSKLGCVSSVTGNDRVTFINNITDDWHALSYDTNSASVTSEWVEVKALGVPSADAIAEVAYNFAYAERETVTVNNFGQNTTVNVNAGANQTIQATLKSSSAEVAENLISNGDFDADGSMDTAGWSLGAGGTGLDTTEYFTDGGFDSGTTTFKAVNSGTVDVAVVTDPLEGGSDNCLKLTASTSGSVAGCDIKGLTAGETYNITFKLYADVSSDNTMQAFVIDRAVATSTYHLLGGKHNSTAGVNASAKTMYTNGWITYSCNVTAGENLNYWTLRFNLYGTNAWYVDDISVKHVTEYAENGGFDTDTTGWSTNASSMTWGASNGNGNGGVAVTNSATEQWIRTYVPVTGGQSYNFSYWFKCTDGKNTRIYTTIIQRAADKSTKTYDTDYSYTNNQVGSNANANSYLIAGTLKPDSTWRNVVGQFTAAEDTVYAEVRIRLANDTGTVYFDDFSFTGLVGSDADGIVANEGDNAMKLSDGNSTTYTVALEAGTYEYSYNVANSGLTTAALKVGDTTYTETIGTFTLATAVSEVAFTTAGTGTAYFDDLVIKKQVTESDDNEVSGTDSTLNGYITWTDSDDSTVAHIDIEKSFSDDLKKVIFAYKVPSYLVSGNYKVYIDQGDFGIYDADDNNTNLLATLAVTGATHSADDLTSAAVERDAAENNVDLVLNGTKVAPFMYMAPELTRYYNYSTMASFADSGSTMYSTNAGYLSGYDGNSAIWTGLDESGNPILDYTALDYEIMRILDLDDNANVMVNLNLDAPAWYTGDATNVDQLVTYSDGTYAIGSRNGNKQISFASTTYAELCEEVVALIVEHMTKAGYADRIFSVRLSAGETGEWMHYGTEDNGKLLTDYSSVALTAFRSYLTEHYTNNAGLQAAWNNSTVTLASATIPTAAERNSATNGAYVDPATYRNVIDYNDFLGYISAKRMTGYAKVVKDTLSAAGADWIVGGYNGYIWNESSSEAIGAAHTDSSDVLASEYIDFIASPVTYSERISGYATGSMAAQDTVALNGKLFMVEQDNRVNRNGYTGYGAEDTSRGYSSTVQESVQQVTRDLAFDFIRNNGYWMLDMTGGWFDDTSLLARINTLVSEYDLAVSNAFNTGSNNEVAVFVSENYYNYLDADTADGGVSNTSYTTQSLYYYQRQQLAQMGVSYDTYTIEDLAGANADKMQDYKVNIVLSPIEITSEQLDAINAKLKTDGKTVVWVYMAGAYSGEGGTTYSADNIEALTDFTNLSLTTSAERKLQATVTAQLSTNSDSKDTKFGYGSAATGPYITIADTDATTLAEYANGDVASAYKTVATADSGTYTSIYSAVPNLSSEFLRDVCEYAGVHKYSENSSDVVETNNSYVAVHSAYGGAKTLTLPCEDTDGNVITYSTVTDIFGNAEITGELTQETSGDYTLNYTLEDGDTALFRVATSKIEKFDWNDGMLENGDISKWDTSTGLPEGFTEENAGSNNEVFKTYDDEKGVVVSIKGASAAIQQAVKLVEGKTYVATFMFKKTTEAAGNPLLQIFEHVGGSSDWTTTDCEPAVRNYIVGQWQIYSVQYTAKATGQALLRYRISGGVANTTQYYIKNAYFDEYKGGILMNGDLRLANMGTTDTVRGWDSQSGERTWSYRYGNYWADLASTESAEGQFQANTVTTEANTTYIAKFTATASGSENATFRIFQKNAAGNAYDNTNTVILEKDVEKDYKIAIASTITSDTLYRFHIAKGADATLSFTNAAFIKNVGDYNEDGVTDVNDIATMKAFVLGEQTTDDFSDLTADGAVNSKDLVRIITYKTATK